MTPLSFFIGHAIALLAVEPPRAPRSIALEPFTHSDAWPILSPAKFARPDAQPRLLRLLACPAVPPSAGRETTSYWVCASADVVASTATPMIAERNLHRFKFMFCSLELSTRERGRSRFANISRLLSAGWTFADISSPLSGRFRTRPPNP